jgi:hypothetical protein
MDTPTLSPLERAFELARSGQCRSTSEILHALKAEGHDRRLVVGPYLMRQLRILMHDAARLQRGS